jgi:enamine deaminase RidA (YjgF/YER057c/UK114 family)
MDILQPPGWKRPRGYSNGIAASGRTVFVAGQVGWNAEEKFETDDFAGQFIQALRNIAAVLAEAGAKPEHVTRFTIFMTSKREYYAALKQIGEGYRAVFGRHYPTMTAVEVSALMEDRAKLEIEATAVVPEPR